MKILWIVNMMMPRLADHLHCQTSPSGTWLIDISELLSRSCEIELAIACVYGDTFRNVGKVDNITYYLLPGNGKSMMFYNKRYEKLWHQINAEFKPDIVHIHGTEYCHGLAFLRACPDVKAVISVQGIMDRIKDVDYGGLPQSLFLRYKTLRQWLRFSGELEVHYMHKKCAKTEREMLRRVSYINSVNTWTTSLCQSINPDLKVFLLEYNLRDEFYHSPKWSIDTMTKHTIFTNPGNVPLKGLHILLEALTLVKRTYPDTVLYVPGMSDGSGIITLKTAYAKYIRKYIVDHQLESNVVFLGRLSSDEMRMNILRVNAVVIPSAIEGASLVLREAMYLGCPCIASFRGGMVDYIESAKDGLLYDYPEYPYLATQICRLFDDMNLCNTLSENAIRKSEQSVDRQKNLNGYLEMYCAIANERESDI